MEYKEASERFFNGFYSSQMILYIGQNINDEEIKEYISKYRWSCIITSRRDPELATFFQNEERPPQEFSIPSEIPGKLMGRGKLPILRLFGICGEQSEEEDLSWLITTKSENKEYDFDAARKMLDFLPSLHSNVNPLVIIGADSDIDWELFGGGLMRLLYENMTAGLVTLWGMPECVEGKNSQAHAAMKKLVEKKGFGYFGESLVEVIKSRTQDIEVATGEIPDAEDDIFYQGGRPVGISRRDLLQFKNVGTLLTQRTLNKIRPLGRVMSRQWFSNFHAFSSDEGPQWYGYLRQSDFHIKRSFEDALFQVVRKMLEGRSIKGHNDDSRLIVLTGHPGSSKSVTLAALAYRIYNEGINPVIFIPKQSFLSDSLGNGYEDLDKFMQELEKKSEVDTRFLVIWDSSAYKSGISKAENLLTNLLQKRGRRCVLVCSSYDVNFGDDEKITGYRYDEQTESFVSAAVADAQVVENKNHYYVRAIRQMNAKEIARFWDLTKEYSGIHPDTISRLRAKLKDENRTEIFDYYFLLITLLRDNLTSGLQSEQSRVTPYVTKEIQRALQGIRQKKKEDISQRDIYQQFIKLGIDISKYPKAAENEGEENNDQIEENEDSDEKLRDLNLCVALFSRFKLPVPYSLAYTMLVGEEPSAIFSDSTSELYHLVTRDIPWLHYGEDSNGNFTFRFRNSLEAEIHLQTHEYSGDQQIDLLCHIIDVYGKDYRKYKCLDPLFTDNLQALLRLMGPNSEHFTTSLQKQEHNKLLSRLGDLIEKLEEMKVEYGVPDEDAGFATIIVTFSREYYGWRWTEMYSSKAEDIPRWRQDENHFSPETYEMRIGRLLDAIELAENSLEELRTRQDSRNLTQGDRKHLLNQQYTLTNEIAQCNISLEDLVQEYLLCCKDFGVKPETDLTTRKLKYPQLYRMLMPCIFSNPTNGFAYNTLFKAFGRTCDRENLSEATKLQYLCEIMQVVETCETMGSSITNRGARGDELTGHINHIKDISSGMRIDLDTIIRHRQGIAAKDEAEQRCFDLYDEILETNAPAAITFVCQKELQESPKGTRELSEDFLKRVEKVYKFMKEDDNYASICSNAYSLAMLIRVAWMKYNKTVLSPRPECQLTRLKLREWVEINRLCREYVAQKPENKQPMIILLYALSALQVSGCSNDGYEEAMEILKSLNEDDFYHQRLWTPFMLCDENGDPYQYNGTVVYTKDNNGRIQVRNVPQYLKGERGLRFHLHNLGRSRKMPEPGDVLSELELGMGFTCLSVYTESGRQKREERS